METKKTNRLLIWAVIILLCTNLSMAVTFLLLKNQEKETPAPASGNPEMPTERRTQFFREQLNLTPEQVEPFKEYNRKYNHAANSISSELEKLRVIMVTELGCENPDTTRLDSITARIGVLHTGLKKSTIEYYRQMDKLCSQEQREKLNALFMSVVNKNEDIKPPQQGGRRYRYGKK